jgi:hypothetical protein
MLWSTPDQYHVFGFSIDDIVGVIKLTSELVNKSGGVSTELSS